MDREKSRVPSAKRVGIMDQVSRVWIRLRSGSWIIKSYQNLELSPLLTNVKSSAVCSQGDFFHEGTMSGLVLEGARVSKMTRS